MTNASREPELSLSRDIRSTLSEALFRSTVVAFSSTFWHLKLRSGNAIPAGPCFIYGNHSNNYDPFMLNAFCEWGRSTAGVMTMEYLEGHFLAPFFSSVGILGTRKSVPEPHLIRQIFRLLDEGRSVVIYPEGGRRWDGRPKPWLEATAKLFRIAGVPVYPVVTHGSYVGWPRWARYPRPAHIELEVLPPVDLDRHMPLEVALDRLRAPIDVDENEVDDSIRPRTAFRPAVGIDKLLYRDPFTGQSGGVRLLSGDLISCRGGAWKGRVLPDSRIVHEASGEVFLTGDLYDKVRSFSRGEPIHSQPISNRVRVSGLIDGDRLDRRPANVSLSISHLSVHATKNYHVPTENLRFVSTERNSRLYVTHTEGHLYMEFRYGGSALQWYDEISRVAPSLRS